MTSKEKAIKAFENVEKFISDLPMSVVGYNTQSASEWVSDQLNIVEEQLNSPNIDDAFKVVEELVANCSFDANEHQKHAYEYANENIDEALKEIGFRDACYVRQSYYREVLTALTGLKEREEE